MYEVHGIPGSDRDGQVVRFGTAAGLLRWALNERVFAHRTGGVPYPARFDAICLGNRDGNAGADYNLIDAFAKWKITSEHLSAMRRARARYKDALTYYREIEPEWRKVKTISYMDSSVVEIQENKYGQTRRVPREYPSGDVSF